MFQAGIEEVTQAPFWFAVLQIVFVNLLLSGDNAVIIAMACRGLQGRQRFWGLAIGVGVSVVLLILFAAVVSRLLLFPYVKVVGGLVLIYIAAKLLAPEQGDGNDVEAATQLWRAVRTVAVADFVMSFDNMIAVAAIANGALYLLAIGLLVSIPLLIAGAAVATALLDRFPILVWAGAALLGWVAGETIAGDPWLANYLTAGDATLAGRAEVAAAVAGAILVLVSGGLWRHWRVSQARPRPPGQTNGR